jgi:branched-subunit amino acid transport protein
LGLRLSFVAIVGRCELPPWFRDALRFVPIAVFSAIIWPEMVAFNGDTLVLASMPRLAAGAVAVAVAWRTRNVLLTIGVGMGSLWMLQWVTGTHP